MGKYLQVVDVQYQHINSLYDDKNDVSLRVREVVTAYSYHMHRAKIASYGINKVILIGGRNPEKITELIDVLTYEHSYKFINTLNAESSAKNVQSIFIQEITDALIQIGTPRKWDISAILELQKLVESKKYKFDEVWEKLKLNADKTQAVGVGWKTTDAIEIGFIFKKKDFHEEMWLPIVRIGIGLGLLENILGKFSWENNSIARVWNANKRDYWELNTDNMEVSFHYGPAEEGNPHGQYALAKMYLEGNYLVEKDTQKAILWLKKSANQGFVRAQKLLETLL